MKIFYIIVFGLFVLSNVVFGFEIEKVIEVGDGGTNISWSPDGEKIAYVHDTNLFVSDLKGNCKSVFTFKNEISKIVWVTNFKLTFINHLNSSHYGTTSNLTAIDFKNGTNNIVSTNKKNKITGLTQKNFEGPFQSFEGNAYYILKKFVKPMSKNQKNQNLKEVHFFDSMDTDNFINEHILEWIPSKGYYLVSLNHSDSILIKPDLDRRDFSASLRSDKKYLIYGGVIHDLENDSMIILIDDMKKFAQEHFWCTNVNNKFNPKYPEILLTILCESIGHYFEKDSMYFQSAIFDFEISELSLLDELLDYNNVGYGQFSPDGKKIALSADGKIIIVYRKL